MSVCVARRIDGIARLVRCFEHSSFAASVRVIIVILFTHVRHKGKVFDSLSEKKTRAGPAVLACTP